MQPLDQLLHGSLPAFDVRIDPPVRAVSNPSGHPKLVGLLTHPRTEKNALDSPGHADMPRDTCHHTVAMSGASSAFMPTTL